MDTVFIEGLVVMSRVGVTQDERRRPQALYVSVKASSSDCFKACTTDLIADAVNYAEIKREAERLAEGQEFCLLEWYGHSLALWVLQRYICVEIVRIVVRKPGIWRTGVPGVAICRRRIKQEAPE